MHFTNIYRGGGWTSIENVEKMITVSLQSSTAKNKATI